MNAGHPRWVIRKKSAHCFEGALFAAAVLDFIGYKPLIVDMRAFNDDDHVIAVFQGRRITGVLLPNQILLPCVSGSLFTMSLRELIMSYFDFFFNINGDKSLRSYSLPFDLTAFNHRNWAITDEDLEYIGDKIESLHHFPVVTDKMIKKLNKASEFYAQGRIAWVQMKKAYLNQKNDIFSVRKLSYIKWLIICNIQIADFNPVERLIWNFT